MLRPLDLHRCPVDQALEMRRPTIVWRLSGGPQRHAELRRAMPQVSQRMLTLHLRELLAQHGALAQKRREMTEPAKRARLHLLR